MSKLRPAKFDRLRRKLLRPEFSGGVDEMGRGLLSSRVDG
jgi:hypothetical protein